jgi:hypothetical protein
MAMSNFHFPRSAMLAGLAATLAWPTWRRAKAAEPGLRIGFQKGTFNLALLKSLNAAN